ncbi:site-specific integrase [Ochrobactrum sp. S46]|nr:site-specific integrase [Ochrobactrum sp. S45]MBK0044234.1 site-specific integrase [Ochrobactrum sp. S46]
MFGSNNTIKSLIERHAGSLWKEGKHRASVLAFLGEISEIVPGDFASFKPDDFAKITKALQGKGNRNSTINRKINALTKLLRAAVAAGDLPNVPVYKRLEENANHLRILSVDEEAVLIRSIEGRSREFAALARVLVETGITVGEAIALRWESIGLDQIHIAESSIGLGRTLPLTGNARTAIQEMQSEARGPFCRIEQPKFRAVWNELKEDIGLQDPLIVPTVLRHTCAARLIKQGIDVRLVQHWLGNRDYKSMLRYETLVSNRNFNMCITALETYSD